MEEKRKQQENEGWWHSAWVGIDARGGKRKNKGKGRLYRGQVERGAEYERRLYGVPHGAERRDCAWRSVLNLNWGGSSSTLLNMG